MIISKGIQIQKLSQWDASTWTYLWDQALYCLNLYLISSPIRSYSNVMKDFLLGIMHILLPSSAPVPAMLGWDSPTLVCVFMFTLPSFFSKFCFNEWYLKVRLMSSLYLSPTLINPNPNLNLTPTPTLVCMFTFTLPFFFSIL